MTGGAGTGGLLRYLKPAGRGSTAGSVGAYVELTDRAGPLMASQGGGAKSGGVGCE